MQALSVILRDSMNCSTAAAAAACLDVRGARKTHFTYSKCVGITGGCLGSLEPFPHAGQAKKAIYADDNSTRHPVEVALVWSPPQIRKVGRKHRYNV